MRRRSDVEIRVICPWEDSGEVINEILKMFAHSDRFDFIGHERTCRLNRNNVNVLLYFKGSYYRKTPSEE